MDSGRIVHPIQKLPSGGYLIAEIIAVHAHECPNWRWGYRHGPCICGAAKLLQGFKEAAGDRPWHRLAEIAEPDAQGPDGLTADERRQLNERMEGIVLPHGIEFRDGQWHLPTRPMPGEAD